MPVTVPLARPAVVIALLVPGCFHPSYDHPRCGPSGECPSGLICNAQRICDAPASSTGEGDDARTGDARTGDGNTTTTDGPATACAAALPIHVGVPLTTTTCVDTQDLLPGCGPPGTREVVFRFDAPVTGNYTFRAFDAGTQNTTNSTGIVDATCTMVSTCAGVLGLMVTAGTPFYVTVEASMGDCTTIDFTVN